MYMKKPTAYASVWVGGKKRIIVGKNWGMREGKGNEREESERGGNVRVEGGSWGKWL
jgi:hypothetical protein